MAYTKKTWVSGETPLSAENMNHIEQGVADAHNDISSLNTKISNKTISVVHEDLTCQAGTIREYTFRNLPDHAVSIPVIGDASSNAIGCYVYRDFTTNGKVRVYSPIDQEVTVYLMLLQ